MITMLIFNVHDQCWHMIRYQVLVVVLGDMKAQITNYICLNPKSIYIG